MVVEEVKNSKTYRFKNWANTYACHPKLYFQPKNLDEIKKVLEYAHSSNLGVRVVGSGHSPSNISCTNDIMINLDLFNRVIEMDKEKMLVKLESGIKLDDLNVLLRKNDLAISNLGSICEQSFAGAISTGTHGTGKNFGLLSTMVTELELLTYDGRVIVCSELENKDIFKASLCSLGSLGIITIVTIKVEKLFKLEAIQEPKKLVYILENMDTLINSAEHFRFWWFPYTDDAIIWKGNRTSKKITPNGSTWFQDRFVGYYLLELLLYVSSYFPSLVPSINQTYFNWLFSKPIHKIATSYEVFNFDCLFKQHVTEWAIPAENAREALIRIKQWIEKENFPAHFPIEVRFVKSDDAWLSPAYERFTCFIGIIMYRPYGIDIPLKNYWEEYESIMKSYEGRPHWAKAHTLEPNYFRKVYPKFDDFCRLREQIDPHQRFSNQYIQRHIIGSKL